MAIYLVKKTVKLNAALKTKLHYCIINCLNFALPYQTYIKETHIKESKD